MFVCLNCGDSFLVAEDLVKHSNHHIEIGDTYHGESVRQQQGNAVLPERSQAAVVQLAAGSSGVQSGYSLEYLAGLAVGCTSLRPEEQPGPPCRAARLSHDRPQESPGSQGRPAWLASSPGCSEPLRDQPEHHDEMGCGGICPRRAPGRLAGAGFR